jgi:hypothetical protein
VDGHISIEGNELQRKTTMQTRVQYFRNGKELTEDEALVPGTSQIRDGVSMRVPSFLADAARAPPRREQASDPRQAVYDAIRQYRDALSNAWRGPDRLIPDHKGMPPPDADEDNLDREHPRFLDAAAYSLDHPYAIHAIDGNAMNLHKPGWRIDPSAEARQRVADARKLYDSWITSAWRGGDADSGRLVCVPDAPRAGGKDAATVAKDHQTRMEEIYAARDAELSRMYLLGK